MFPVNARYKTPSIDETIGPDIQSLLWNLIDNRIKQKAELDYLQVFELSFQQIVHRQEQPPYRKSWPCPLPMRNITIWTIDSGEYCTMMLPSDY